MKKSKQGKTKNKQKAKNKMKIFEKKKSTRKFNIGAVLVHRVVKFKEKPDWKWDKGSGIPKERPHLANLPTCEKEMPKKSSKVQESLFSKGKH